MDSPRPPRARRVRTPTVLQMEATECGAAALGIILAYHGRHVPLEELRVECRVSRDGSNALYIKKTAEKYGLEGKGFGMEADELPELRLPLLVFWERNHFLVVEGFGRRGKVYLNDPASGRRTVDQATFRRSYARIVFEFRPKPGVFRKGGRRPSVWRSLRSRMRGARGAVAFAVLAGLALMVADLVSATFNLVFVDRVLIDERWMWVRPLLLVMAGTAAFRLLVGWVQHAVLRRLQHGLALNHSVRFLWHVLRLPIGFYQQRFAGDVAARVESNSVVADLVSGQLATTAVGLLMLAFYAAVMAEFDLRLAAIGVAIGGLNLVGIAAAARLLGEENHKLKQAQGKLYGSLTRAVQIIETVKAGASEPEALTRLTGYQARVTNAFQVVGAVGGLLAALPPLLSLVTAAAVLGAGGARVIEGLMSVGALIAFQSLMASFNRPFNEFVRLGTSVQSLQAELARLDDVMQYRVDPVFETAPPAPPPSPTAAPGAAAPRRSPPTRLSGHLVLRDVTFGFHQTAVDEPLVRKFSLELKPGSRVALVGTSGSGKSTLGRLVAGLYRPWEGEILYDGFRLDEIPRDVFTSQVGLVDDQTFLFSGTVRENLTLWDETVGDLEVHRAAIDAGIHRDLIQRRGGYYARLAEGARNLSGGQRQRLEIARALIRNPALLVLDEATSALDPVTEAMVDDNLRRRGCTCLIIAHRLSTIRDCDEIVVLRQGRVIQRGTHDELMADRGGFYHELQTLQADLDAALLPPTSPAPPAPRSIPAPGSDGAALDGDDEPNPNGRYAAFATIPAAAEAEAEAAGAGGADAGPAATAAESEEAVTLEQLLGVEAGDLVEALRPFGTMVETAGNLPLPLDETGVVWRVVAGQVDVFHVQAEPGQPEGTRRHLCRVEEGGSVFAMGGVRGEAEEGLLAVGVGPARLLRFPVADLLRLSLVPAWRRAVADMVDDWVGRVSRAAAPGDPPALTTRLEADDPAAPAGGRSVSARRQVLWVRDSGGLRFLGDGRVPDCPFGSRFPVTPHSWVVFDGAEPAAAWDTETLMENGDPWVGLRRFHRVVLDSVAAQRAAEAGRDAERRAVRRARDAAITAAAVEGLARLLRRGPAGPGGVVVGVEAAEAGPPGPGEQAADDPLLAACAAVGAARGVAVLAPPHGAGDSDDPLRLIARASGFRVRRVRLDPCWWSVDSGPLLAWRAADARPLALLPTSGGGYVAADPTAGTRTPVTAAVAETLAPRAVMFYRTLSAERAGAWDLLRFSAPAVAGEFRTVLLAGVAVGLLGLTVPWVTGTVIDDALPRADGVQLWLLCGFLALVGLFIAAFQAVQGLALVRVRSRLESDLLPAVWDRLLNLPARFFTRYEAGDLALRAMGLARVLEVMAGTSVTTLLLGTFSLFNLVALVVIDPRLAAVAVGLVAVAPLATALAVGPLWRCQRRLARAQGEISALLLTLLGGIARLRAAGAEARAFSRWAALYRRQLGLMIRFQRLSDRLLLFGDVWPLVVLMGVFAAVSRLGPGAFTPGQFLAFLSALGMVLGSLIAVGKGVLPLLNGLEQYERLRPVLEAVPESADVRGEVPRLTGAFRVANLSFRYDPDGPLVLDGVNIHVRRGEFVAVVGPSGSGKSTLLRLLLGFEAPTEGVVAYDGRELNTLDVQEVRRQVGVVLQDAQLRPGDVFSNIVGFGSTLTEDDAWEAADLAGLADDLEQMPMGLHTVVGEGGSGLSSGQRQRLLIARALAGRPRILFFDEATSALDNRTQAHVQRSLHDRLQGTTRVAIAHRLSTVVDADRIYVLVGGRVVQSGSYAQLIREPGPFQDLARRQVLGPS